MCGHFLNCLGNDPPQESLITQYVTFFLISFSQKGLMFTEVSFQFLKSVQRIKLLQKKKTDGYQAVSTNIYSVPDLSSN